MACVKDLKDQILTEDRAILFCTICGSEYSANAGDYWAYPPDYEFTCCGEPMILVNKRTVFDRVE